MIQFQMSRTITIRTIRDTTSTSTTTMQSDMNRDSMSTTEKLSLITTQIMNHLRVQKTLNEILMQSGDSTVQVLIRESDDSLSTLENEMQNLTRTGNVVVERNIRVTTSTSTTTSAAVSTPSTSSPRTTSRLNEKNKSKSRRSVSVGDESANLCAICLDSVPDAKSHACAQPMAVDGCNHVFHDSCLKGWLKVQKTCPTCRNTVKKRKKLTF